MRSGARVFWFDHLWPQLLSSNIGWWNHLILHATQCWECSALFLQCKVNRAKRRVHALIQPIAWVNSINIPNWKCKLKCYTRSLMTQLKRYHNDDMFNRVRYSGCIKSNAQCAYSFYSSICFDFVCVCVRACERIHMFFVYSRTLNTNELSLILCTIMLLRIIQFIVFINWIMHLTSLNERRKKKHIEMNIVIWSALCNVHFE